MIRCVWKPVDSFPRVGSLILPWVPGIKLTSLQAYMASVFTCWALLQGVVTLSPVQVREPGWICPAESSGPYKAQWQEESSILFVRSPGLSGIRPDVCQAWEGTVYREPPANSRIPQRKTWRQELTVVNTPFIDWKMAIITPHGLWKTHGGTAVPIQPYQLIF